MFIEWEKLPRKTMSSGGLFFDEESNVLIVKPNYKEGWSIPGGTIELQESPLKAYMREVGEEIGLQKKPVSLLCVDYVKNGGRGNDHVSLIFDGGVLSKNEISNITLQTEELREYKFVPIGEAINLFAPNMARRAPKCFEARATHKIFYLENGEFTLLNS